MTPATAERIREAAARFADELVSALAEPAPADTVQRLYTVSEAAEALRVARSTLYGLVSAGRLKSHRVGGRRLIASSDLTEFLSRDADSG
ncbi:hypothetical protein BH24CHL6_BH24CHL6_08700 [soil metagenome]